MSTLLRSPDVTCWEVEGEAVVYNPASGSGHILNPTALGIWRMLDGTRSDRDIEQALAEAFPDSEDSIRVDVPVALRQLVELGLAQEAA